MTKFTKKNPTQNSSPKKNQNLKKPKPYQHTWARVHPRTHKVTFVIGADDGQWHKNPIVTIISKDKGFKMVEHCSEIRGLPTWMNFWLLRPVINHRRKDNLKIWIVGSH